MLLFLIILWVRNLSRAQTRQFIFTPCGATGVGYPRWLFHLHAWCFRQGDSNSQRLAEGVQHGSSVWSLWFSRLSGPLRSSIASLGPPSLHAVSASGFSHSGAGEASTECKNKWSQSFIKLRPRTGIVSLHCILLAKTSHKAIPVPTDRVSTRV